MRQEWLAQVQEDIIDPERPICDPHHHLWDHEANPYLLPQLLGDVGSGHNVTSTVFVECASMYRADGPEAMRPVKGLSPTWLSLNWIANPLPVSVLSGP